MTDPVKLQLKKRAAYISVAVGVVLFCLKMGGYLITGSAAILSDAMESVVHVLATAFAAYSVILSARPADKSHPYGHGKIEFLSAGFEGGLIVLAALAIAYTAVPSLIRPPQLPHLEWGTLITALAGVVNLILGWYLISVGRTQQSLTLVADGKHVLTDSYTSLGVLAGLLLVWFTGWRILDPVVALAVAVNIVVTGTKLIRHSVGGLMDEVDQQDIAEVTRVLNRHRKDEWIDVHRLRSWRSGEVLHLDFHLTLPFYKDIAEAHDIEEDLEKTLRRELPTPIQLLVHHDPCVPTCCMSCQMADCNARQQPFEQRPAFDARQIVHVAHYWPADEHSASSPDALD